ncbi:MAG: HAD family hydrolase [Vicinamibacteria bacterium]
MPEPFELVVFDLDGVLADTSRYHASAWAELFAELGRPAPPYETIAGMSTRDVIVERAGVPAERAAEWVSRKQQLARRLLAREDVLFPDAGPAVRALASKGLRLAVGTGASRETAEIVLARLGLAEALEAVVTASEVGRGKPDPEVYARVLTLTGVAPERALVAEDSEAGVASALAAGADVATVRSGYQVAHSRFFGAFADLAALAARLGCRP